MPASLLLVDIEDPQQAERFLRIVRASGARGFEHTTPLDLVEDAATHPGETLRLVTRDDGMAAALFTVRDERGAGSTYLRLYGSEAPPVQVLADLVDLAEQRATAGGVRSVQWSGTDDDPSSVALVRRHGFRAVERWYRFRIDPQNAPRQALLSAGALPQHVRVATLASRPALASAAHRVHHEGLADAPGDFPRPDTSVERWLAEVDGSRRGGRELVLMLIDGDDEVLAVVELRRDAAAASTGELAMLSVDRSRRGFGIGGLGKRAATQHARELGFTELRTLVHVANQASVRLNERQCWTRDPDTVSLRRTVPS